MICHTLHLIRELKAQPSQTVGEVFVDECHRTQSGKLHRTMKAMMPDAVFIGFTGTPLRKKDKKTTQEVFGGYIHTYKFDEAVEDGVVLDLVYEARDIDQHLSSQDKVDAWFEAKTRGLNAWQKVISTRNHSSASYTSLFRRWCICWNQHIMLASSRSWTASCPSGNSTERR